MTKQLLSFHNRPQLKDKYIARVKSHEEADRIIKGTYWQNGKGCAVGCTIEGVRTHDSFHKTYEKQLGLPEWLAYLEDHLFENLSNGQAQTFPRRFLEAINPGSDLTLVKPKFMYFLLEQLPKQDGVKFKDVNAAVRKVMELLAIEADGKIVTKEEWVAAESAAWNAAWNAARSAAWSAARSAAWSAARSAAWSAARSAESAAWSAAWSAESAAWSAGYSKMADKLLELLREAK